MRFLHILVYGARLHVIGNPTVCGKFVRRDEIAIHDKGATCAACLRWVLDYNALKV